MATKVVATSGGDFTSAAAWTTYFNGLGTLTTPEIVQFREPAGTLTWADKNILSSTTSTINNLTIMAYPGEEADGGYNDCAIFQCSSGSSWAAFLCSAGCQHITIQDIEFWGNSVGSETVITTSGTMTMVGDAYIHIDRCVAHDGTGLFNATPNTFPDVTITNCVWWNAISSTGPIQGYSAVTSNVKARYCTFIKNTPYSATTNPTGIRYALCTNCAILNFGGNSGWFDFLNPDAASDYNASHDTSAPGAHSIHSLTDTAIWQHPGANWNLQPISGSVLLGAGTPISGVTTDILGNTRSATAPTIGAYENVMPTTFGIDFRATRTFVTDPSGYIPLVLTRGIYPLMRGGVVFGYDVIFNKVDSRDRSATVDHRLAGLHFWTNNTTNEAILHVDLPVGTYDLDLAMGDPSFVSPGGIINIYDNATLLTTITVPSIAGGHVMDLGLNTYTDAAWPSATRTVYTATISSGLLRIGFSDVGGNNSPALSSLYITPHSGGPVTQNINPSGLASTLGIGTDRLDLNTNLAGLASTLAIGTMSLSLSGMINLIGLASTLAIGTDRVDLNASLAGIASTLGIGSERIDLNAVLSGIPSTINVGTDRIDMNMQLAGLPSTVLIGTNRIDLNAVLQGIASTLGVGTVVVASAAGPAQNIQLIGISSVFGPGVPTIKNPNTFALVGVSSTLQIGVLAITQDAIPDVSFLNTFMPKDWLGTDEQKWQFANWLQQQIEILKAKDEAVIYVDQNPNGAVSARPGTIALNLGGGAGNTCFIKTGGGMGNTGWTNVA